MFTFNREKVKVRGKAVALYTLSAILCLMAALIYIYPSIRVTGLMYEYFNHKKTLAGLKDINKKMNLEISALRSYDFIERRAVVDLGYVFPSHGQVVIIVKKTGRSIENTWR
ncbi:hypothetical protein MNBD_NITROSPINAE02-1339 [hydrothermal vent metagenome]|uniref:Cell division protein FtsL n=1 Tax=hydrothermal vent metagenome TaxID=652676 RepID=A0A3B1BFV9_9ZZZZ